MLILLCAYFAPGSVQAQVRPQYTLGINATNSGLMPDPGFTYANVFQDYSFNHLQSAKGHNTARLMMVDGALVWIIGESFHNIIR